MWVDYWGSKRYVAPSPLPLSFKLYGWDGVPPPPALVLRQYFCLIKCEKFLQMLLSFFFKKKKKKISVYLVIEL